MKTLLSILLALLCLALLCLAQPLAAQTLSNPPASVSGLPPLYLGHVATSTGIPQEVQPALNYFKGVTPHQARDNLTSGSWYIEEANWYVAALVGAGNGTEVGVATATTIDEYIEYPAGVYTHVTWGGSNTGSIASGTTLRSDGINVSIPAGSLFYRWYYMQNATAVIYRQQAYFGNRAIFATGTSTLTPGETIASSTLAYLPVAIIGWTREPSVNIVGDSIAFGWNDTPDNTYNLGYIARSIGGALGYANLGVGGDRALWASTNYAKRGAIAAYGSCTVSQYGINDILNGGQTAAQTHTSLQALYGVTGIAGKTIYQATLPPAGVTTTDAYVTETNQTVGGSNTTVQTFNNTLRGGVAGIQGVIDAAKAVESITTPGKWQAPAGGAITGDGTHPVRRGYLQLQTQIGLNAGTCAR